MVEEKDRSESQRSNYINYLFEPFRNFFIPLRVTIGEVVFANLQKQIMVIFCITRKIFQILILLKLETNMTLLQQFFCIVNELRVIPINMQHLFCRKHEFIRLCQLGK